MLSVFRDGKRCSTLGIYSGYAIVYSHKKGLNSHLSNGLTASIHEVSQEVSDIWYVLTLALSSHRADMRALSRAQGAYQQARSVYRKAAKAQHLAALKEAQAELSDVQQAVAAAFEDAQYSRARCRRALFNFRKALKNEGVTKD